MPHELLSVQPSELKFFLELKKQVSCSLQLVNVTDKYVAFKVKTTSPKKYCVRPNAGVVLPQSSHDITVTMQAQREAPADLQCKDKFLVQSVVAPDGTSPFNVPQELFDKENGRDIHETKLRVVYLPPPQPPSPVPESAEEIYSPLASSLVNVDRKFFAREGNAKELSELKAKLTEAMANLKSLTEEQKAVVSKNQSLQQELASTTKLGKSQIKTAKSQFGFSFWSVLLVGVLGILVGYLLIPDVHK